MPIEQIQLKNGQKYPVSPMWREPVVPGREMDFSFAADTADAEAVTGGLVVTQTMTGGDPETTTYPLLKVMDEVFTPEELRALSGQLEAVFSDQNDSLELSGEISAAIAGTMNTACRALFYLQSGGMVDPEFTDLAGSGAMGSWRNAASDFILISVGTGGTYSQQLVEMEGAITYDVTETVPEAGTYFGFLPFDFVPEGSTAVSGELTVAKYHADPHYVRGVRELVIPLSISLQMIMGSGTFDLPVGCENLEDVLKEAVRHGDQLNLIMDFNSIGMSASVQTTSLMKSGGTALWSLSFGVLGNEYAGFSYNEATHTITLIAAS